MYASGIPLYRPQTMLERYRYNCATLPSTTVMDALQTFLKALESASILDKFVLLYAVADTDQSSRLNLISPGNATLIDAGTAPTFVSGVGGAGGFTPNGAAMSTQTRFGPAVAAEPGAPVTLNSLCILYDSGTTGQDNNQDVGTGGTIHCRIRSTSDISNGRICDATTETIATGTTDGSGLFGFERDSSTNKVVYRNGSAVGNVTRASAASGAATIFLFGSAATSNISTRRCRLLAVSSALGATAHSTFNTAWAAYKTAIGCT